MQGCYSIVAALLVSLLLVNDAFALRSSVDVCVIGAGPAGLHAADLLEAKGKTVTVLEQQNRVGGRVVTSMVPASDGSGDVGLDLGAVLLGSQPSRIATKYAEKFNLTMGYFLDHVAITATPSGWPASAGPAPVLNLEETHSEKREMMAAIVEQYLIERSKIPDIDEFDQISERLLKYAEVNDTTLLKPFRDYLQAHHPTTAAYLESFYAAPLTMFGYGGFDECPALYALKYLYDDISHGQLTSMTKKGSVERAALLAKYPYQWRFLDEPHGFQTMFEKVAATLSDVRLQVKILAVLRPPFGPVRILYADAADNAQALSCGRLVLAFPPRGDRMGFIDLDPLERSIYDQVYTESYYSAAVPVPGLFSQGEMRFYMANMTSPTPTYPPIDGRVQANVHLAKSDYTQVCMLDALHSAPLSDAEIRAKIATVYGQTAADNTQVLLSHDYFPHVPAASMPTFLRKLKALQGYRKTYYAGTVWVFDDVEFAMQSAKYMTENYF